MSTTITYNGSTITQVNNETKTLLTGGKWLTGNIVLTDVSDGSGGGTGTLTTKNITQNGTYNAYSDNADGYSQVIVNINGEQDKYILTTIVPEQTVTPQSYDASTTGTTYYRALLNSLDVIESNSHYLITFNNKKYVATCNLIWDWYLIGNLSYVYGGTDNSYPCDIFYNASTSEYIQLAINSADELTIKVEKLTLVPDGVTLGSKTINMNGTYNSYTDDLNGYSSVSVNVPNGISITEVANTTGTTAVIVGTEVSGDSSATLTTKTITVNGTYNASSDDADGYSQVVVNVPTSGGSTPSATQHTIHLEFADETTTDILMYYEDSFVSSTITSTVPDKYGQKSIVLASLDGTSWYVRPTETWETLLDRDVSFYKEQGEDVYPYCWITTLEDVQIPVDSVWKVTFNNNEYRLIGKYLSQANGNVIGNPKYLGGQDDNSGVPFILWNSTYGAWTGGVEGENVDCTHYFKIERLVTESNSESE